MKKMLLNTVILVAALYMIICVLLYFFQEKVIFFPEKLSKDYQFNFTQKFTEITIPTPDNINLHALVFKAERSKGVIFYLHGNAGSLSSWGDVAQTYTDLSYDVFILDYRGFGKSEGKINSQKQFFQDIQTAYDKLKTSYAEDKIIVLGYSIGTGPAAKIAAVNEPGLLILQAPYYSMTDMMRHTFPILPTFILKYKFKTYQYLKNCTMPVVIFHGQQDEVIYYDSSVKLKKVLKQQDTLITLAGQGHNGMTENQEYRLAIQRILGR